MLPADIAKLTVGAGTGSFSDKNAGIDKTVTAPVSITGGTSMGNYTYNNTASTTADITPLGITGNFTAASKPYDGNNSAVVLTRTLTGVLGTDDVSLTGGTATFDNANVGNDKTVTLNGATLSGTDAGNYALSSLGTTTADITGRTLTIAAVSHDKVYGSAYTFNTTTPPTDFTISGLQPGDAVTSVTIASNGAAGTANVGTYPIVVSAAVISGSGNYNIVYVPASMNVITKDLTVSAVDKTKTYGSVYTFDMTIPSADFIVTGLTNGDAISSITLNSTGAAAIAIPGTHQIVPSAALGTAGTELTNYNINYVNATLTVGKALLTVTANDNSRSYSEPNPLFTATITGFVNGETLGTSGISGTPSLTTTADLNSPIGTYPITAALGSLVSSKYDFTFVPGTLVVGKAVLTVVANDNSRLYGAPNPALTYTISGFVNGETLETSGVSGSPSVMTTADVNSPVGSYAIIVTPGTLSAARYDFVYVNGTLIVGKARLTVTANDNSRPYGTPNPLLTATISGFVNGETLETSGISGSASVTTAATTSSPIGTYTITTAPGTLTSSKYDFTFVNGTLVIGKAMLTVTANDNSRPYGADNPALSATISGFTNGETLGTSGITGSPIVTTTATSASPVGSYTITVASGSLSSTKYDFTYINGTLIVGKAMLTVTADDYSRLYGAANPTLTAIISGYVNGETFATSGISGSASVTTTATSASSVGSYTISAAQGTLSSARYDFTFVNGRLTVNPAPLTITANDGTKTQGTIMSFAGTEFSSTGLVNGNTITSVTLTSTGSGVSATAGTYPIVPTNAVGASGTNLGNYIMGYVNGTLTVVGKPVLTVTANNNSRLYGAANPALTATITGYIDGDTFASSVTGTPGVTTTADVNSFVGSYTITAALGTLASAKYDFTFVDGTLTVGQATLTVTASALHKFYGSTYVFDMTTPSSDFTVTGLVDDDRISRITLASAGAAREAVINTYPIIPGAAVGLGGTDLSNYSINYVNGTLEVGKVTLTVTANDNSRLYGAANPLFNFTINGFVNGETLGTSGVSGTPGLTTTADLSSPIGSYPIIAALGSLVSSKYDFTFVPGTLVVGKAPLTITANNATKTWGTVMNFAGTEFTTSGLVNGNSIASVTLTSTGSGASASAGTYPIVPANAVGASGTNLGNYTIGYVNGTLTVIGKPVLTVTANNNSRLYGAVNPALTATITGFTDGETLATSDVTGSASVTTTATAGSPVGSYTITSALGTLASTKYSFTFVNGTLSVGKATLTVNADNLTKIVGSANPTLTASYTGFVNGDSFASSITGSPALSTTAVTGSPVGAYPITITQGTLASVNYNFTLINGTLTVISRPTLTVTADNKSKSYGSANPALTVTITGFINGETLATSGVTGSPSISTTATTSSSVGNYTIRVTQGTLASTKYNFSFVNGSLTISKAILTVTADNKSKHYGDANPTLTYTMTGYVLGQTRSTSGVTGNPGLSTTATRTTPAGTYPITPVIGSLAASNYSFTFVNGTMTVDKFTLTVRADNKSRIYGSANPTLTATITGFVNGETLATSGITGSAGVTTTATESSSVGSYTLTAAIGTLTSSNYTFTFVNGTLTVSKATLTVTADNKTKNYRTANPPLTATITGFVNGQTLATSGVTGTPALSTTAGTNSPAGTYPITATVGTLASANYSFTYVNGTLTILSRRTLTVTANNLSRTYGSGNPALTYTFTGFANGDNAGNSTTGTPSITTTATSGSSVGTYPVTIAQGNLASSNYDFEFVNGTLTVNNASLIITAAAKTKVYGAIDPALTYSITSGTLFGTDVLSGSLTRDAGENVGSYAITRGTLTANSNYTVNYIGASMNVTPLAVNVTAQAKTKVYGQIDPSLTYVSIPAVGTHLANNLVISFSGSLARNAGENVGTYSIGLGSLGNSNYTITYTGANQTITPLAVTVTANPQTKRQGTSDPPLTYVSNPATGSVLANGQVVSFSGSLTRQRGESVGTYPILIGSVRNSNYTITFAGANLTITNRFSRLSESEVVQGDLGLNVYPNPFTDHLYFDLQMQVDANVILEVYNLEGVKLARVFSQDVKAFNDYRIDYAPENVASGVLIYRVFINGKIYFTGKAIHK